MVQTMSPVSTRRTPRPPRPRIAGTWYVVRDTQGALRHTGPTRKMAVAPYQATIPKKIKRQATHYGSAVPMRRTTLWQFLLRRGWRCERELRPDPSASRVP